MIQRFSRAFFFRFDSWSLLGGLTVSPTVGNTIAIGLIHDGYAVRAAMNYTSRPSKSFKEVYSEAENLAAKQT